ncbi:MAG TPA: hypothetical protein VGR35_19375 [Tepidisphaeraceae bacterium]|nr:hypothetical protein [Tepidisphaeraceae bacterium]
MRSDGIREAEHLPSRRVADAAQVRLSRQFEILLAVPSDSNDDQLRCDSGDPSVYGFDRREPAVWVGDIMITVHSIDGLVS